jgi:hypothetical protein
MASDCISVFNQSRSPIASTNWLDHGLQVHLSVHSISAFEFISKLVLITASKYIVREREWVDGDTGVTEVE